MQDAVRAARQSSVQQQIETLKEKHCLIIMECSLEASVVDAPVKQFSLLMKPRGPLPYNAKGPCSQSVSIQHTNCFFKFNFNINTIRK